MIGWLKSLFSSNREDDSIVQHRANGSPFVDPEDFFREADLSGISKRIDKRLGAHPEVKKNV